MRAKRALSPQRGGAGDYARCTPSIIGYESIKLGKVNRKITPPRSRFKFLFYFFSQPLAESFFFCQKF